MHTFISYVLLPSGWHPVSKSLIDADRFTAPSARAESARIARDLYPTYVTKTIVLEFK